MALTAAQRMDLAADVGIADDESVFSDAELDRNYARESNNYKRAVVRTLWQLLADPVKFKRYAECVSEDERKGLRASLEKRLARAEKDAGMAGGSLSAGTMTLGLDQPDPATDTTLSDYERDF